jgi:hypothetical protein
MDPSSLLIDQMSPSIDRTSIPIQKPQSHFHQPNPFQSQGNISDHDLLIKLRRVTDFFAQGHSVRLILLPTASQVCF